MKELIKNFFIKLALFLIAIVVGAVFYKIIVKECINIFITIDLTGKKGFIIYTFFKLTSVMFVYGSLLVIFRRKISLIFKVFLTGLYLGTMFILLFARPKMGRGFNFDVLAVFRELESTKAQMYFIGNIVFFMPIGFLLRKDSFIRASILAMSIELNIELVQYAFKRGYFDVSDIFINLVGIFSMYFMCRIVMYIFRDEN